MSTNILSKLEVCSVCGEKTQSIVDFKAFGGLKAVHRDCKCERDRREFEEQACLNAEKMAQIEKLKSLSLLRKIYKNVTFESTLESQNPEFNNVLKRCKRFCENHKKVIENGHGIYIWGDIGTGKTHLTACIANELLNKCVPVLFTNLFEVSKAVRATFKRDSDITEQNLMNQFSKIDFLIFDDLGSEVFTNAKQEESWLNGLLYDLINSRYNAGKSTIFTSNYGLKELVEKRGIAEKTVNRIFAMTNSAVMRISGESMRGKFGKEVPF